MTLSATVPLPSLPEGSVRRPPPGRYRTQYGVILIVEDEATQATLFARFRAEGFKVRIVCT